MTVLDTFFIKFTSNADEAVAGAKRVEEATKSVEEASAALLKAQEDAGKKVGKNLSQEEHNILRLRDVQKKALVEQRSAEKEQEIIDKRRLETGNAFIGIIGKATTAVAAYLAVSSLSQGTFDAAKTNSGLRIQADLFGQNAEALRAFGEASKAFGGTGGEIFAQYRATFQEYAQKNINIGSIEDLNNFYRKLLALPTYKNNPLAQQRLFQQQNIPESQQALLLSSDEEYKKRIDFLKQIAEGTEKSTKIAREFEKSWADVQTIFDKVFTRIGDFALPILTKLNLGIKSFYETVTGNSGKSSEAKKEVSSLFVSDAKASIDSDPLSSGKLTRGIRNNNPGNLRSWAGVPSEGGFAKFSTADDGIKALSKQLELYNGRGNNTIRGIISTYAPPSENNTSAYIAAVSKGTGFNPDDGLDIGNASIRAKLVSAIIKHENGSNPYGDSRILGLIGSAKKNIDLASTSPYGMTPMPSSAGAGKNITVKTGDIIVNTKATTSDEISRNIASELNKHLKNTVAGIDDGIGM